ncbi:Unknown protein, partial [Striga hermonthica]
MIAEAVAALIKQTPVEQPRVEQLRIEQARIEQPQNEQQPPEREQQAQSHERQNRRADEEESSVRTVNPQARNDTLEQLLAQKVGCTWEMIKQLIREKYYPTYYRAEMERQFLSLQQGTRTVDEYEREFTRLAAFVPDLVRTE